MSRDHRKLRVFHDVHALTLAVYKQTVRFPKEEWYGIRQQIRRAATSVPTNLVEGSARTGTRDYCKFLVVALGSACEVAYLIELSRELLFLDATAHRELSSQARSVVHQMQRLVNEVETLIKKEEEARRLSSPSAPRLPVARSPQPEAR